MTLGELLAALEAIDAGAKMLPLIVVLLWGAGAAARRAAGSVGRLGKRVGDLETAAALGYVRTAQLEEVLRCEGVRVPPWPFAPPAFLDGLAVVDAPSTTQLPAGYPGRPRREDHDG